MIEKDLKIDKWQYKTIMGCLDAIINAGPEAEARMKEFGDGYPFALGFVEGKTKFNAECIKDFLEELAEKQK